MTPDRRTALTWGGRERAGVVVNSRAWDVTGRAVTFWGVLAGVGGATHTVGELVQGGGRPSGVVFDSWTWEPIATRLGGEPAMTLVPDLTVSAALTACTSATVVVWSLRYLRGRHGPAGMAVASTAMMLLGGGFGPPLVGLVTALAAHLLGTDALRSDRMPRAVRRVLAASWPWLFRIVMADMVLLFLGSVPLALAGLNAPNLFVGALFLATIGVPLTALAAVAAHSGPTRFPARGTGPQQFPGPAGPGRR